MSQRLRPSQRIRSRRVFEIIFKRGKSVRGTLLNLWGCEDPEATENRGLPQLGVIVSRKVSLRAVRRNLWKRRIREAFRRRQAEIKKGFAILIQAKKQNGIPSYQVLEAEMIELLSRLGGLR